MDNKFLKLINRLLKGGVEVDGVVQPTVKGVPQGGVVSPLLANIVLNKLDWFIHSKGFHDIGIPLVFMTSVPLSTFRIRKRRIIYRRQDRINRVAINLIWKMITGRSVLFNMIELDLVVATLSGRL